MGKSLNAAQGVVHAELRLKDDFSLKRVRNAGLARNPELGREVRPDMRDGDNAKFVRHFSSGLTAAGTLDFSPVDFKGSGIKEHPLYRVQRFRILRDKLPRSPNGDFRRILQREVIDSG